VQTSDKVAPGVAKNHYSHPKDHIGLDIDSLRELLVLIEDYNRGRAESEWIVTTTDAANKLVKVKTAGLPDGEAAWINLLAPEHVGIPVVFISHAWGGKIVSLLKAVIAEADERLPTEQAEMYYFDMVSVDQQKTDQVGQRVRSRSLILVRRPFGWCNAVTVAPPPPRRRGHSARITRRRDQGALHRRLLEPSAPLTHSRPIARAASCPDHHVVSAAVGRRRGTLQPRQRRCMRCSSR
jgi:hypothetical protein